MNNFRAVADQLGPAGNTQLLTRAMLCVMELPDAERKQLADFARDGIQSRHALISQLDRWEQTDAGKA